MPVSSLLEGIGAELDSLFTQFTPLQLEYKSSHNNRYFQGVGTPQTVPEDGNAIAPDLSLHPSDQAEDWDEFGATLPSAMNFSVALHTYYGDAGQGWVAVATVIEDGKTWTKQKSFGSEVRDAEWAEMVPMRPR